MTFGVTAFAETSFAADTRGFITVGTFPIFPFNSHVLTFVMALNFETGFDLRINSQHDYAGKINTQHDYILIR